MRASFQVKILAINTSRQIQGSRRLSQQILGGLWFHIPANMKMCTLDWNDVLRDERELSEGEIRTVVCLRLFDITTLDFDI